MRRLIIGLMALAMTASVLAQDSTPTLFISPMGDGFDAYLTAAMHKKNVPVKVTTNPEDATYTLKASQVEVSKESGGSKFARCLFAYCAGIADSASTSVTLVTKEGIVAWSYSVKKGKGSGNRQSMAEAVAKHMQNDFFLKKK